MRKTSINEVVLSPRINGLGEEGITGGEGVVSSNLACPTILFKDLAEKSEVALRTCVRDRVTRNQFKAHGFSQEM